jgi:superoxide reductase
MKRHQVLKCQDSPLTIEVLGGAECGEISCCGKPMKEMEEKTADFKTEKHVPILQETPKGVKVIVGSTPHPMLENHYIEWIEVVNGPYVNRKYLKPGEAPEAEFYVKSQPGLVLREYCNVHGLWKGETK